MLQTLVAEWFKSHANRLRAYKSFSYSSQHAYFLKQGYKTDSFKNIYSSLRVAEFKKDLNKSMP